MSIDKIRKPIQLRIIFILNALMMFLPFLFYYVFKIKNITIEGLDPIFMIYTGVGYILSFILLVVSILKRKVVLFRSLLVLNILIALPVKAYIGIIFAVVSILISLNGKVKGFFSSTGKIQML